MDALEKRLKELEGRNGRKEQAPKNPQGKENKKEKKSSSLKNVKTSEKNDKTPPIEGIPQGRPLSKNQHLQKRKGVLWELLMIGIKILAVLLVVVIIFTFIFGITRNTDISMFPSVRDGDLIIYYRLDKGYVKDDTIVVKYNGEVHSRRVMAVAGDTVDINENGLYINGSLQAEKDIHEETLPYETGVRFPITVGNNEVFVLGDGRENAADSRIYGCVNVKDSLGKVMMVIRTRGI